MSSEHPLRVERTIGSETIVATAHLHGAPGEGSLIISDGRGEQLITLNLRRLLPLLDALSDLAWKIDQRGIPVHDEWLHYGAIGTLQALGWADNWWDCELRNRGGVQMVKVGADQVARYRAWRGLPESEQQAALMDIAPEGDADGHDQEARDA